MRNHDDHYKLKSTPREPDSFWSRVKVDVARFARIHLIESVVIVVGLAWIAVSFLVYLAERGAEGANITSFGKGLWWGIVTFLTVGYGDYYPITGLGRMWASILMLTGVLGIAIITSKISSYFLEQALREGRGIVNTAKLKNHFIVCGWKEDMHELLSHILDFNPGLEASELVLIANLKPSVVDALKEYPRLKGLQVIVGDYFEAVNLKRAAPERAKKVLILADRTPSGSGAIPTMTEVDARTIMTAMTISNLSRGTLVTAEVLDPKMDQYLKLASVSEIIYSREYSRLLLGNASGGTGISNIIFDLLDPKTSTLITTQVIADSFVGQTYAQFKSELEKTNAHSVVIGILENTGNSQTIKESALRKAQKTPDVQKLVANLRSVREMRCNHPVFSPNGDYRIPEGAMAIVIATRATGSGEAHASTEERNEKCSEEFVA